MQEAIKNYRPPEIVNAVKEYATEKLDLGESVKELRQKKVTNIKYKVRGALDAHLVGNSDLKLDIQDSIFFLKNQEYLVEYYEISHLSTYGFVFMHPKQLKNLEQHGWLTLIDSTHKTNRYDCRLFTLYIRDYYGCWNVGAHFFVSKEDSVTIAEGLKIVRRFARHWSPRYFLSDQSNIESNSIRMAFPGLKNGEQDCDVIFCTVTSTNALESYHSELKRLTSPQHGLIGACHKIVELDKKKCSDSEHVAYEFRVKRISAVGVDDDILQEIHKFPFPVQQMLISEFCAVEGRMEKGKSAPGLTSLHCYCLFFHRYLLPCRHIFHEHAYGVTKLLTSDVWEKFQRMFDEAGFDIYISRGLVDLEVPRMTEAEKATENRRLAVSELMERVRDMYWRVEETGNIEQTGTFIRELKNCIEPVLNNQMA
ncbi:hypothetical protein RhiirA4_432418 [Rhizophagus irregularis]|uniref:ZSWIM1/3 RNaseH-like domain-containing protein n=1 Tax=Rhizophagus irregularis TaxID=588596 RepID=A0A2I1HTW0_9GLOM|nr:hypothetical protein RhiirA4_432418 [Rhizophagus irregularis]